MLPLQNMHIYIYIFFFIKSDFPQNEHLPQLLLQVAFLLHHVVMFPATRAYNLKGKKAKRYDKKAHKDTIKEGKSR